MNDKILKESLKQQTHISPKKTQASADSDSSSSSCQSYGMLPQLKTQEEETTAIKTNLRSYINHLVNGDDSVAQRSIPSASNLSHINLMAQIFGGNLTNEEDPQVYRSR